MSAITRFTPSGVLETPDPFGDFDKFFKGFMVRPVFQNGAAPQMKLELSEDDKSYTLKAEIPGVKKEDIQLSVDGNQVSISAEVKKESEKKQGKKVVHSERYYGRVARSFTLESRVDQDGVKAKYTDGVLEAVLPKKPGGKNGRIAID